MRAVIQRVLSASVTVDGTVVSSIGEGLCVLVGITTNDTAADMEYIARKILGCRLFEDEKGKHWTKSVVQRNFEVLCVSQFTLFAKLKGNKPDFHLAMGTEDSKAFYENFLAHIRASYKPEAIKDGVFGAMMKVDIVNNGPVTIMLDSQNRDGAKGEEAEAD